MLTGYSRIAGLLLLVGLWSHAGLWAQEASLDPAKTLTQYVHEVWQAEQGLPQSTVTAIVQTQDGYLWLGTQEGLVRFNGSQFTVFDKRNTPAFATSHNVRTLFEDRTGTFWIGTFGGGLVRYTDGQFFRQEDVVGTEVSAITADRDGALWIGTLDAGLFILRAGTVTRFTTGLASDFISTLHIAPDGSVWAGTEVGLYRIHQNVVLPLLTTTDGLSDNHIEAVFADSTGTLWIGTRGGLNRFRDGALLADHEPPPFGDDVVLTFFEDRNGSLWMGTGNSGLARYRAGRFDLFTQEDGLTHNRVRAIYQDQEGSLWVGTDGGGLNRLRDDKFTTYTEREGLISNMVLAVYEDADGTLWIASEDTGLNRFKDGVFTHFTTADGLSDNTVYSLAGDGAGTLWIGTDGGGLNRLKDGIFTHFTTADGLAHDAVSALYDDGAGTLWIGTNGGVSRLRDGQFTNYTPEEGLASPYVLALHQDRQGALWIGTYGGGLQRLHSGAFTTHYTTKPSRAGSGQPGDGLGTDIVLALYEDAEGTLWIGTYGGGLSRLKDGTLTTYTTQDGLFSDTIAQILEDEQGHLWMSSNLGLFCVSKADLHAVAEGRLDVLTPVVYGKADGLKSQEMNGGFQPAGWKDQAGRLWFPSTKGVAMIDPAHMRRNEIPPPVVIESVIVDRIPLSPANHAELAPGKDKVDFQFAALSFIDPDRVAYTYKLDGYDDEWSEPTAGRTATYTNLDPGSYTFRVIARNRDGVWNETGATFSFYLRPFFYQTIWFWMLVALGFGLAAFGAYRVRIERLKARQSDLEHAVDERTKDLRRAKDKIEAQATELWELNEHLETKVLEQFQQMVDEREVYEQQLITAKERAEESARLKSAILNNMSHEFRTPLTTILGYTQILSMETRGPQQEFVDYIDQSGKRLMRTLNAVIELARLESRMVEVKQQRVNIADAVNTAVALHRPEAEEKGLVLHTEITAPGIHALADRDAIDRVIHHLVDNAVKFTNEGEVTIRAATNDDKVLLQVRDTGIGIGQEFLPDLFDAFKQESEGLNREHEGSGLGLTVTRHFVRLMGGTIHVESARGKGCTFTITLNAAPSDATTPSPRENHDRRHKRPPTPEHRSRTAS